MARKPLSEALPPLVLGTGTFNVQFHPDPSRMPYTDIVRRALARGVAAFDTSPYYGPSESLLGDALATIRPRPPRDSYFLITKAGRVAGAEFDYSPRWVRYSVCRSLDRLGTDRLDLVYMHDAEFASQEQVVDAVRELRRLRDRHGLLRYVGISGYPVDALASLAEAVLRATGEPLDAVMSYANFTLQSRRLGDPALLARLRAARVDCVPNASILGMGLLTTRGVDAGPMASWHPAPPDLRAACHDLARLSADSGEHLEELALRWSMANWARTGADFGAAHYPPDLVRGLGGAAALPRRIGVSVMGVTSVDELEEAWRLWRSVVGLASGADGDEADRQAKVSRLVDEVMRPRLGDWLDYAWESGGPDFKNERVELGVVPRDAIAERWGLISKDDTES